MPQATTSDEQLMQRICENDRSAFEILYERYFDKLVWFAGGFTGCRQKSEDIVQEVFMKIIHKPQLFNEDKKFAAWAYTLTANACKNLLRNEQNRVRILIETAGIEEAEKEPEHLFIREQLEKVYDKLNDKEKNLFTLRLQQEFSIKEIAGIMNIPEGSVKSGVYYLLKKLASELKEFKYEEEHR